MLHDDIQITGDKIKGESLPAGQIRKIGRRLLEGRLKRKADGEKKRRSKIRG